MSFMKVKSMVLTGIVPPSLKLIAKLNGNQTGNLH